MAEKVIFTIAFLFPLGILSAQEVNFGLHFNPVLTHPVVSSRSVYDKEVRPIYFTVGYNTGLNVNYKINEDVGVESGVNLVQKTIRFNDLRGSVFGAGADYYLWLGSTSVEFPLLVNYRILHNERNTTYDMYVLAGAAYEINNTTSGGTGSSSSGNGKSILKIDGSYNGSSSNTYITPVIGLKINAILRRVGLIDYGISYHFPLQATGPYNISASLGNSNSGTSYKGTLYAHMSYIDFKLCYYFLNLTKELKRIGYMRGV